MYSQIEKPKTNNSERVPTLFNNRNRESQNFIFKDNRPLKQLACIKCEKKKKNKELQEKILQRVNYATTPSCEGISKAYPILGVKCANNYAKISHAPDTDKKKIKTYKARVNVLKIFRQARLCNGLNKAPSSVQSGFLSGEKGHIDAADNVRASINDKNKRESLPESCRDSVTGVSIKKQQCK